MNRVVMLLIAFFLLAAKCSTKEHTVESKRKENQPIDLIQESKNNVIRESASIDRFVKSKKWKMQKTGTGLRYLIYENGEQTNPLAKNGQYATINFDVTLMNGKECYASEEGKPETFLIGRDNVESGLHEGILLMRVGDKARFIMPSHLAYGLVGDMDKIPGNSPIVYNVELVGLR